MLDLAAVAASKLPYGSDRFSQSAADYSACKAFHWYTEGAEGLTTSETVADKAGNGDLAITHGTAIATMWATPWQLTLDSTQPDYCELTHTGGAADHIAPGTGHLFLRFRFISPAVPAHDQGVMCYGKPHTADSDGFEIYLGHIIGDTVAPPYFRARAGVDDTNTTVLSPWGTAVNYADNAIHDLALFWDRSGNRILPFEDGLPISALSGVPAVSTIGANALQGYRTGARAFTVGSREFTGGLWNTQVWAFSNLPSDAVIAAAVAEMYAYPHEFPPSFNGLS